MNEEGYDDGNDDLAAVSDLPILQDDATAAVWTTWGVTWRDVYVLDGENELYAVYNLSEHDLSDAGNYAELYDLLIEAAGG